MSYTVSARNKEPDQRIDAFLQETYPEIVGDIDSVFGFTQQATKLYGGRNFYMNQWATRRRMPDLTPRDVDELYESNVGLRLPLTNLYTPRSEYEESKGFLEQHCRLGNTVIVYSDHLAEWIKEDFPRYHVEASVIKELNTLDKIERALELYDSVVPAFELHEDYEMLDCIRDKDRIRLFANVSCERTCPARICYAFFSKVNKNPRDVSSLGPSCSREVERLAAMRTPSGGIHKYDVERYKRMGFTKFKMLRSKKNNPGQAH